MFLNCLPILFQSISCNVIFYSTHCFSRLGLGEDDWTCQKNDGLYYLKAPSNPNRTENNLPRSFISEIVSNKAKIWLHHRRLGHPSFNVLKILFLLLFKGIDVESLHCDICEFVKHCRVSFPISNNRTFVPFLLIHSDIWGPFIVPNVFGARWFVSFIDDCTHVT